MKGVVEETLRIECCRFRDCTVVAIITEMLTECSTGVEFSFDDARAETLVQRDDNVLIMLSEERDNTPLLRSKVGNCLDLSLGIACSALQLCSKLVRAFSISTVAGSNL